MSLIATDWIYADKRIDHVCRRCARPTSTHPRRPRHAASALPCREAPPASSAPG